MKRSNYIGPVDKYDFMGAWQFSILFQLGLRHYNSLLDFGAGSLRLGRFLIQYLDEGNYFAIEPQPQLIQEGKRYNYLTELFKNKKPNIRISDDCNMAFFGKKFDYIIAQSVFTHMPIDQIRRSLQAAYTAMDKRTIFIVNYHHGKADYKGTKWDQAIIKFTPQTMNRLIEESNLHATPLHLVPTNLQTWLMIRK